MKDSSSSYQIEMDFCSIYTDGRKVSTYKLALALCLLDLKDIDNNFITLDDLSPIFSEHMLRHIKSGKRQVTAPSSSKLVRAIYDYWKGKLPYPNLLQIVRVEAFKHVIDRFHTLPGKQQAIPFYVKDIDMNGQQGIRLTEAMSNIISSKNYQHIREAVEAHWVSLETHWGAQSLDSMVENNYYSKELWFNKIKSNKAYIDANNRKKWLYKRLELNVFQENKCFYCDKHIDIESNQEDTCDIDHFLPHSLMSQTKYELPLDEVWNLVLSCKKCNWSKGPNIASEKFLTKLKARNEYIVENKLTSTEEILFLCGNSQLIRLDFLEKIYLDCTKISGTKNPWEPKG